MAGGGNDSGSRRGDPYREVAAAECIHLVLPPPRDAMVVSGLAFIFACIALSATTGAAFVWGSTESIPWRVLSALAAIAYAAWIARLVLRETWTSRRVEIDPVARVVRVFAPGAFGLSKATATVPFEAIRRIDADATGCVRIACRDDRSVEVVDILHPCTLDDARRLSERICELVFGAVLPLPPQPAPPKRTLRVAEDDPEMQDDAGREKSQAPRRREGWDE